MLCESWVNKSRSFTYWRIRWLKINHVGGTIKLTASACAVWPAIAIASAVWSDGDLILFQTVWSGDLQHSPSPAQVCSRPGNLSALQMCWRPEEGKSQWITCILRLYGSPFSLQCHVVLSPSVCRWIVTRKDSSWLQFAFRNVDNLKMGGGETEAFGGIEFERIRIKLTCCVFI